MEGSQCRSSRQEPEGRNPEPKAMEEHFLLTCSLGACSACFFIQPGPTRPDTGLFTIGGALPMDHQSRKWPIGLPIGHLMGACLGCSSLFPEDPALFQINKKTNHQGVLCWVCVKMPGFYHRDNCSIPKF